ncbi:CFIA complex component Rna14 [Cordyceps javanica]|nr:CFIA complex component Rna14 [Cordyceps javanica]
MASDEESWAKGDSVAPEGDQAEYDETNTETTAEVPYDPGHVQDDGSDDGADYDPESVGMEPTDAPVEVTPLEAPRETPRPKMAGGFIVEASDDDEDATPAQNAPSGNGSSERGAAFAPGPGGFAPLPPSMAGLDPVTLFEARIKEDPRGDMDAWLNLMKEHRGRSRLEELRKVYHRFLEVFPQAGDIWVQWIELELGLDNFVDAEQLFGRCLMTVPNIKLWTVYLNYIRRRNDLNNDPSGQARRTVTQSYEFVIDNIGVDRDSGDVWLDYVQFIKNGPGLIGGTGWQDQQKMDQLRKVYHRAINVPMSTVNTLWKEYDQFEMGLNKVTGRKFIQERSPGYMSAKSGNIALDNITKSLHRVNLPRLPPAPGFDGDTEYREQVELWTRWISWEKDDPLVLKEEDPKSYTQRVMYCYKQALMALRFWPELWVDAAEWCFQNDIRENDSEIGTQFLVQGIAANPQSVLLALKYADRIEATYPGKEGDKSEYAEATRKPYDAILDTLYSMGDKVKEREKLEVSTLKQAAAQDPEMQQSIEREEDENEKPRLSAGEERIKAIQQAYAADSQLLSRTISYIWIALARAMRRIQGKGNQTEGGLRKVFTDARHKGRLTSDVYVAVALLESVVYKDPVGAKIFERGARLFPNDEEFMIEYLKFLHSKDDTTNARVVFETCVNRLISKPETLAKARPLYAYFHKYESQYGELSQISKLEERMAELFPEDPKLKYFTERFASDRFDPIQTPIIVSKAVQMRPKRAIPVIEEPATIQDSPGPVRQEQSPRPQFARATASPKRPFGVDDDELNPPKRVARGVSPLKGAAGRRLDQQRRNQTSALQRDITFLLGILPPAHTYDSQRLTAASMIMADRGRTDLASGPPSGRAPSQVSAVRSGDVSRGASPARTAASQPGQPGWTQGPGFDPARLGPARKAGNTRMELPPDAYVSDTRKSMFTLRGNNLNTEGSPATIEINQYRMTKFDFSKKIYQYDVALSPDPDKKTVILKKIWEHPTFKNALQKYTYEMWICDGNKLAWSPVLVDRGELRFTVNLDDGRPQAQNKPARQNNTFLVTLRKTTEVQMSALKGYLEQRIQFNNAVNEALNFVDHLIRQWPSQNLLAIKRNFYKRQAKGRPLLDGSVVEVHKGTYASVRLSHNLNRGGVGLALNADIANTCFWVGNQTVDRLLCNYLAAAEPRRWRNLSPGDLARELKPVRGKSGQWESSDAFKQLRKLRRLKFTVRHPNRTAAVDKVYTIQDIVFRQDYGAEGGTARMVKFEQNGQQISVAQYYEKQYKAFLRFGNFPLIDAGKGGYIPMEFAMVEPMQRYPFKLNPDQTAAMIKIAVTRPRDRRADIQSHVNDLQIPNDPFLRHYGVQFDPQFTKVDAKVLAPPAVNFGTGTADPKFSGRWDLRGKKFWKQNFAPLANWAFLVLDNCVQLPQLKAFSQTFKSTFIGHGGKCTSDAMVLNPPGNVRNDVAESLHWAHTQVLNTTGYPQLIFVVVQHKNSPHYMRLKKSADCRFGILTQVVNGRAVNENNGQYHSNVCMKVNAKLGGATARTTPPWKIRTTTYFPESRPTMIIGVDVSHAAPGGVTASVAAMTMSVDKDANRYAAAVETNGYRTEMLTPSNINFMFGQLSEQWKANHGVFPKHIIYFRDGVAEGQFAHVIEQEINEIKRYLSRAAPNQTMPQFTVIVATKRHHIRFFPQKGDRNGNALPGTLVEKEVTHPFMWDFYLCSHVAIQGTARPVHYNVIMDEAKMPANELQKMIYHQSYSYARSTTPVSLHPAVYYAHLAGDRARAHENVYSSDGFQQGGKGHEMARDQEAKGHLAEMPTATDAPKLLPLGGKLGERPAPGEERQRNFFRSTMWYI